jgi:hypothetical protein
LFAASPTETVMPTSRSMSSCRRASVAAGVAWCRRVVPERSSQASSSDSVWIRGVTALSFSMIRPLSWRYLAKFGLITTASGQSLRAVNIGMAERTPDIRAM